MTDYSKATDHDLNELVAHALKIDIEETYAFFNGGEDISKHSSGKVWLRKVTRIEKFWPNWNPCNDWKDAGPIIEEFKISINSNFGSEWKAIVSNNKGRYFFFDKNPLRAAMAVFLMMREQKND